MNEYFFEKIEDNQDEISLATETVLKKLDSAVKKHLISDVPVGVFMEALIHLQLQLLRVNIIMENLKHFQLDSICNGVNELSKSRK